jgi:hypothetical protein
VLVMLTMLSMVAAPVLLLAYGALALSARPRT